MSTDGTKVTSDPEGLRNPIQEGTGFVASDSLAADSLNSGGSFAGDNPNAAADPQSARGSTANTTDTSAASRLDPASSAPFRDDDDAGVVSSGAGKSAGRGPTYNTDSTSDSTGGGASGGYGGSGDSNADRTQQGYSTSGSGADSYDNAGTAPTYVGIDQDSNAASIVGGPKGANLSEGGFDGDAPNASFNNEIGTKNDPGRVAENQFSGNSGVNSRDAAAARSKQGGADDGNQYSTLGDEQA